MINVNREELNIIKEILQKHIKSGEARAFGSRYKGINSTYSDLDIANKTDSVLTLKEQAQIREDFEESELSFRFDVLDYNNISPTFRTIIDEGYEVIFHAK